MEFFLVNWAVWMPTAFQGDEPPLPELPQVPAMTRRRMSKLTKLAFDSALNTLISPTTSSLDIIYASRHGDLHKTLGLLAQVAAQEALSPTQFALSVHNAIAGQLSLYLKSNADACAISAGADSLHYALLEAAIRLNTDPALQHVLVVYADEPVPQVYQDFCHDPAKPVSVALLLHKTAGRKFILTRQTAVGQDASTQQAQQLLPLLKEQTSAVTIDGRQCQWLWSAA